MTERKKLLHLIKARVKKLLLPKSDEVVGRNDSTMSEFAFNMKKL